MISHFKRLSVPLIVLVVASVLAYDIGLSRGNLEVIVYKFIVFCASLCVVHLSRKALFPYIDLSRLCDIRKDPGGLPYGMEYISLAVFAYYIGMTYILTAVL